MPVFSSESTGSKCQVSRKLNDRGIDRQEPHRQALKCPKEGYVAGASKRVRRRPPDRHFQRGPRDPQFGPRTLREPSEGAQAAQGRVEHSAARLPGPRPCRCPGAFASQERAFHPCRRPDGVLAGSQRGSPLGRGRRGRRTSHSLVSLMPCFSHAIVGCSGVFLADGSNPGWTCPPLIQTIGR
jgi:hypothetical protein